MGALKGGWAMVYRGRHSFAAVLAFGVAAAAALFLSGLMGSEAVQNPRIALDMVTTDNT